MSKPIEAYIWPTPNGHKITIALEEMGLPYVLKPVNIGKGEQFAPDFIKISPNNKMPAIVDPDGPGGAPISIFESGAILQYLGRKSGKLYPQDERARIAVDEWLFWQVANLGPMAGQAGHFVRYAPKLVDDPAKVAYGRARYVNELNRLCGVMERRLGERDFLAGDYSIADIATWPWARGVDQLEQSFDDFPNLKAWIDRIAARSGVERGMKAADALREGAPQNVAENAEQARNLFGQTAASVSSALSKQG